MNKRYIYNPEQSAYFIQQGCVLLKVDKHRRTGRTFWVFDKEDSQEAFIKWSTRNR